VLPRFGRFADQSSRPDLRQQRFAQAVLGLTASVAVPVLTLLLVNTGSQPLIGWLSSGNGW
jgi:hypothetical protein